MQGELQTVDVDLSLYQLNRDLWNKDERSGHDQTLVLPVCTIMPGATHEQYGLGSNMRLILKVLQLEAVSQLLCQS